MIPELALGILITCSSFSGASSIDSLVSVGDKLRITTQGNTEIVIIEKVSKEHLVYHSDDGFLPMTASWSEISKIEKEMPRSRIAGMGKGMGVGFFAGFVTGFVFGVIVGATDEECPKPSTEICIDIDPVGGGLMAGLAVGAAGMLVGGMVGAAFPGNGWTVIEPNISAAMTIEKGNTLTFQVAWLF